MSLSAAIAELEQTRANLAQQLAATDTALDALRAVMGSRPAAAKLPDRRVAKDRHVPRAKASGSSISEDALCAYLREGPSGLNVMEQHFKINRYQLRKVLGPLEARGVVRVSGTTASRRAMLAAGSPAKEAPQRGIQ